jgi:hypothetical protein
LFKWSIRKLKWYYTIKEITSLDKKIIILGEVPIFTNTPGKEGGPLKCIKHNFVPLQKIIPNLNLNCTKVSIIDVPQVKTNKLIAEFVSKYKNVIFFDPINYFCDKENCFAKKNNKLFYSDDDHLNVYGSYYIGKYFDFK